MKIKKFNENWQDKAYIRKDKYAELFEEILETMKDKLGVWIDDKDWHYTGEMYDLLKGLIDNLERFDEETHTKFVEKLEKINIEQ